MDLQYVNRASQASEESSSIPALVAFTLPPKQSFKLPANPLKSPRVADEWESYLAEKRADHFEQDSQPQ